MRRYGWALAAIGAGAVLLFADAGTITGAGATFPAPIYRRWISDFTRSRTGVAITYDAVGSEEGLKRLEAGTVDFAAVDFPLSSERKAQLGVDTFPTVIGGVVPAYNLPGLQADLRFTADILAGIYLGRIRKWNDPQIKAVNHGIELPDREIVPVHRADGSGTTYVWSEYLTGADAEWRSRLGTGSTLAWPVGKGAEGNEGVANEVTRTPYAIGYVEFIYALQHEIGYGAVRNGRGKFVRADIDSLSAAAADVGLSTAGPLSITNGRDPGAYPISSFTWMLVRSKDAAGEKRAGILQFLDWSLSSGQKEAAALGYVALPERLAAEERRSVRKLLGEEGAQ